MPGKVYLVGAGCGASDLITLRGQRVLAAADVVVYDALMDPDLLQMARPDAEKSLPASAADITVCPRRKSTPSWSIWPGRGKTVCRLKGGDPFVFGRGRGGSRVPVCCGHSL